MVMNPVAGGPLGRAHGFNALFPAGGTPDIRQPDLHAKIEALALPAVGRKVAILFGEGPGDPIPAVRFVTRFPGVTSVDHVARHVGAEPHHWADWVPMLAAIQVTTRPAEAGTIQELVMKMDGVAAKMIRMGTVTTTNHVQEDRHGGLVQSRWRLLDGAEGDLLYNQGSWTLAPTSDGVVAVYEGKQVPGFFGRLPGLVRRAAVAVLMQQAKSNLPQMVGHLAHRAADPEWTKRSPHRPADVQYVVEHV